MDEKGLAPNSEKFKGQTKRDAQFVSELVASNYEEVQLARLATERASNPEVKKVAQMLEEEHSQRLNELKMLAQRKAITIPLEEPQKAKSNIKGLGEE